MSDKIKKIISILLNIVMVILFIIFTFQSKISYSLIGSWSEDIIKWAAYTSVYIGMTLPLITLFALLLSISYRKEEAYTKSVVVQALPFLIYILTVFFSFISQL